MQNKPVLIDGEALALSGGGYRSTLFQMGVIIRMNELGMLCNLKCISGVSGGSIASGYLGLKWSKLNFVNRVAQDLFKEYIDPLRAFCSKTIDAGDIVGGWINPTKSAGEELVQTLDRELFSGAVLEDLPNSNEPMCPRFVFSATSLNTGARFWFSREDIGDWMIGCAVSNKLRLARAVAASSAFPPFFSPLRIDISGLKFSPCLDTNNNEIPTIKDRPDLYDHVDCGDGGIYDNLALGAIWESYKTLWVSDASMPVDPVADIHTGIIYTALLMRINDLLMRTAEARRRQDLLEMFKSIEGVSSRQGTYWSTSTAIENFHTEGQLLCEEKVTEELARLGTRLAAFTEAHQCQLINWGYALADAAIRRNHTFEQSPPPPKWPYKKYQLSPD